MFEPGVKNPFQEIEDYPGIYLVEHRHITGLFAGYYFMDDGYEHGPFNTVEECCQARDKYTASL